MMSRLVRLRAAAVLAGEERFLVLRQKLAKGKRLSKHELKAARKHFRLQVDEHASEMLEAPAHYDSTQLVAQLKHGADMETLDSALAQVPRLASFSVARRIPLPLGGAPPPMETVEKGKGGGKWFQKSKRSPEQLEVARHAATSLNAEIAQYVDDFMATGALDLEQAPEEATFALRLASEFHTCRVDTRLLFEQLRPAIRERLEGKAAFHRKESARQVFALNVDIGDAYAYVAADRFDCEDGCSTGDVQAKPQRVLLIPPGELWLKGGNRELLLSGFADNVRAKLGAKAKRVRRAMFNVEVEPAVAEGQSEQEALIDVADDLWRIPGVQRYYDAWRLPFGETSAQEVATQVQEYAHKLLTQVAQEYGARKERCMVQVKVRTSQKDKTPLGQYEVRALVQAAGQRVHAEHPEVPLAISFSKQRVRQYDLEVYVADRLAVYVFVTPSQRSLDSCIQEACADFNGPSMPLGIGGQPTGRGRYTEKVVCLLSGGIDSPVAAFRMMKRGCKVILAHFQNVNQLAEAAVRDKIEKIARQLSRYQVETKLLVVPFAELQQEIILHVAPQHRMLVYRYFMLQIAQAIARKYKAKFLCTGDSMNQVASQTARNLEAMYRMTDMPLLAPLIGENKDEITTTARRIGTFELSALPYGDCCSYFIAKHPTLYATEEELREWTSGIDKRVARRAMQCAQILDISAPDKVVESQALRIPGDVALPAPGTCGWMPTKKENWQHQIQQQGQDLDDEKRSSQSARSESQSESKSESKSELPSVRSIEYDPSEQPSAYLDNAATTPLDASVLEAMRPFLTLACANAHSPHAMAKDASRAVYEARQVIAESIGAKLRELTFTSGGSEANNLAIKGSVLARVGKLPKETRRVRVITQVTEHDSVLKTVRWLGASPLLRQYVDVKFVNVKEDGTLDRAHLQSLLDKEDIADETERAATETFLVSVMQANNENGVIFPVHEYAKMAHAAGALIHVDACQSFGKLSLRADQDGEPAAYLDMVTLNAHKLHGPKGIGCLYVRGKSNVALETLNHGGGHEFGLRSGTLNVPGIVGFAAAVQCADTEEQRQRIRELRQELYDGIVALFGQHNVLLNGPPLEDTERRLYNNLSVSLGGHSGEHLIAFLSQQGVYCATGSACSSNDKNTPSHVLLAMRRSHRDAAATLRFSLSRFTQPRHVQAALQALALFVQQHGRRA